MQRYDAVLCTDTKDLAHALKTPSLPSSEHTSPPETVPHFLETYSLTSRDNRTCRLG